MRNLFLIFRQDTVRVPPREKQTRKTRSLRHVKIPTLTFTATGIAHPQGRRVLAAHGGIIIKDQELSAHEANAMPRHCGHTETRPGC